MAQWPGVGRDASPMRVASTRSSALNPAPASLSGTALTVRERFPIAGFAKKFRLPSTYTLRSFVEAGGLVSYAIDWRPTFAQTAEYVDRILRGARPGDLPVTLPTGYETAVNLKTAAAIGVTIPDSILLRADWVIKD